jgi:hypothetical protein
MEVVRNIRALPPVGFPKLVAITHSPVLRPDGTMVDKPGYDSESQLYYAPSPGLERCRVPEQPDFEDVRRAVELLREPLIDFPFEDDASQANALSLLITPVLRPIILGPVPLAVIDAPKAGTGKGLLVDVVAQIATDRPAPLRPLPKYDEEIRKTITSTMLTGPTLVCFDNVEGQLDSPYLALALTSTVYVDRILGLSKDAKVPNRATWIANGNNVQLGGDLPRRCYHIRLDARTSKPHVGRTFRYPQLIEWVKSHRGELVAAILTIGRAWIQAGKPLGPNPRPGSFESWSETIGGVLHFAGITGFLGNADTFFEEASQADQEWEAFLVCILTIFKDTPFTVAELLRRIEFDGDVPIPADLDLNETRKVGKAFARRNNTRFGQSGIYLRKHGSMQGVTRWQIVADVGF